MNGTGNVPSRPFGSSGAGRRGPPACATHALSARWRYAARCVPTLPADNLVYTTCAVSGITRDRVIFEIVRGFGETADGIAKATGLKTDRSSRRAPTCRARSGPSGCGRRPRRHCVGRSPSGRDDDGFGRAGRMRRHARPAVRRARDRAARNAQHCPLERQALSQTIDAMDGLYRHVTASGIETHARRDRISRSPRGTKIESRATPTITRRLSVDVERCSTVAWCGCLRNRQVSR
ncbi:hypothetical protein AK34_1914 [Burkholderia dolosa AU0158]|nr:hypothetical protein AK34_1914 [Burkholderia dolosa AU0158]VWB83073.1 hypothetical protein BDO18943_03933 [Burkholderia dolosa]